MMRKWSRKNHKKEKQSVGKWLNVWRENLLLILRTETESLRLVKFAENSSGKIAENMWKIIWNLSRKYQFWTKFMICLNVSWKTSINVLTSENEIWDVSENNFSFFGSFWFVNRKTKNSFFCSSNNSSNLMKCKTWNFRDELEVLTHWSSWSRHESASLQPHASHLTTTATTSKQQSENKRKAKSLSWSSGSNLWIRANYTSHQTFSWLFRTPKK